MLTIDPWKTKNEGQLKQAGGGNLLIHGDNLDALRALIPFYRGQVKCIFIDPPYNTRSAFEHYDDNLEHSQWLSLMLPRLQLLRELLREDGSIAYQATVPNQNDGATIEFLLTAGGETSWTFENPQHDFPKKIEYVLADSNTLNVFVSGDGKLLTFSFVKH